MGSISLDELMQKLPEKRQRRIMRGVQRLNAKYKKLHAEDAADARRRAGVSAGAGDVRSDAGAGEVSAATPVPMTAKGRHADDC